MIRLSVKIRVYVKSKLILNFKKKIENSKLIISFFWLKEFWEQLRPFKFLKLVVTKTRCTTLFLSLLWSPGNLNISKCSPYVWQLQ